jgi:hypothetical protein
MCTLTSSLSTTSEGRVRCRQASVVRRVEGAHMLEPQGWELVDPTLREWDRVLRPGDGGFIGAPDAGLGKGMGARGAEPPSAIPIAMRIRESTNEASPR